VPLSHGSGQLGHVNLGVTSVYLDGIDTAEIIETVHAPTTHDSRERRIADLKPRPR
jgi:hypothetical protein